MEDFFALQKNFKKSSKDMTILEKPRPWAMQHGRKRIKLVVQHVIATGASKLNGKENGLFL